MSVKCKTHARHLYNVETFGGVTLYSGTSRIEAEMAAARVDTDAGEEAYFVAEAIANDTLPVYCPIESDLAPAPAMDAQGQPCWNIWAELPEVPESVCFTTYSFTHMALVSDFLLDEGYTLWTEN